MGSDNIDNNDKVDIGTEHFLGPEISVESLAALAVHGFLELINEQNGEVLYDGVEAGNLQQWYNGLTYDQIQKIGSQIIDKIYLGIGQE